MSVELRPLGVNCNIQCQYCYQNPQRDAGNLADSYDMEAMKEAMDDKALWADIEKLMGDKEGYLNWKNEQKEVWFKEWDKHGHKSPDTLAIWSDHENHTWVDMTTKENMSKRLYGDDLVSGTVTADYLQPGSAHAQRLGQQCDHPGVGLAVSGRGRNPQT